MNTYKKKQNEHNAIQSAINICKMYYGLHDSVTNIRYPDEENRDEQEVDCVFQFGSNKYALEHSIIEAYNGQIEYVRKSYDVIKKVNDRIEENLLKDKHYNVLLPPDLIIHKRKPDIKPLVDKLCDEIIRNQSSIMPGESFGIQFNNSDITILCDDYDETIKGMVHRLPTDPIGSGNLLMSDRVGRLLKAKLPKLAQYKRRGYTTILIVEDVSGRYWGGINKNLLPDVSRKAIISSIDIGVRFVSHDDKMIVGSIWKDGAQWHDEAPMENRFKIDGNQAFKLLSHKRKK
jgi:hypothetical protein